MHTVIMQVREGTPVRECLEYLWALGIVRIIFPPREYGAPDWSAVGEEETRPLNWRSDGGYADRFLEQRNEAIPGSQLTYDS
jgi:hypothetical protein